MGCLLYFFVVPPCLIDICMICVNADSIPKVTIVTIVCAKVRIVQATCNPSETYPTLTLTLRAIYGLGEKTYDKNVAFDVLKWILSPPEPAKELAVRCERKEVAYFVMGRCEICVMIFVVTFLFSNIFIDFAGTRLVYPEVIQVFGDLFLLCSDFEVIHEQCYDAFTSHLKGAFLKCSPSYRRHTL